MENPTLIRPTLGNVIKFLFKRPDLKPPRIEFPMRNMRDMGEGDFPSHPNDSEGTPIKAYRVPLKEGYTLYIPPIPFHQYIFPPVIPRIPPLYFPIDRGWYLYDARKDKVYVKLLTSSIGDGGKLKEKIKEGFHDTIFPQTITYIDFSKQFMRALMRSYSFFPLVRIIFGDHFLLHPDTI